MAVHLLAAYCSRSMRSVLAPAASREDELRGSWTAEVPWKLLGFHTCRAVVLPLAMGVGPYWVAALGLR